MTDETPTEEHRAAAASVIAREQGWTAEGEDDPEPETYDTCSFEAGPATFLVLTDDEAQARAIDDIRESLWAFNAEFLASYMPEGIDSDEIIAIRGDRCESANPAMLALVEAGPYSFVELAEDAISADGLGHFLAGYDGAEIEAGDIDGFDWYGYRTN